MHQAQNMLAWRQMNQRFMLPGYGTAAAAYMYDRSLYQNLYNNLLGLGATSPLLLRHSSTPMMSATAITHTSSSMLTPPATGAMLMAAAAAAAVNGGHSPGHDGARSPITPNLSSSPPLSSYPPPTHPAYGLTSRFHPYLRPQTSATDLKRVDAS